MDIVTACLSDQACQILELKKAQCFCLMLQMFSPLFSVALSCVEHFNTSAKEVMFVLMFIFGCLQNTSKSYRYCSGILTGSIHLQLAMLRWNVHIYYHAKICEDCISDQIIIQIVRIQIYKVKLF